MRNILFSVILLAAVQTAQAAELRVLSAGGPLETAKVLAAEFTKQTGTTVTFDTGSSDDVRRKMEAGDAADIVMATVKIIEGLDRDGKLKPGTKVPLAQTSLAVAGRAGAPKPDISTVEKFRAVMLAAKSVIVRIDPPEPPRPDARIILDAFARIGIADQMAAKTTIQSEGRVAGPVARGEIEFAIQNSSQLVPVKGVEIIGPVPKELQHYDLYSAGIGAKGANPTAAQAFIAYLKRPEATAKWQAGGFEPVKN